MADTNVAAEKGATALVKGMKAKLDKLQKVKIKIPVDKQNPKDLDVTVQINGYTYIIKRGVEVEVPKVVKTILERGKYI